MSAFGGVVVKVQMSLEKGKEKGLDRIREKRESGRNR